jgi:DNA/RNA-binding domain of Phe-tRNA-synthetase-like protein
MLPAASAAAALAQLHNHKVESDWDSEIVRAWEDCFRQLKADLILGLAVRDRST